jgi:hypothetical protein
MKILFIIFCSISPIIINAQSIDYNNFKGEILNDVTFRLLNEYTSMEGGYSLFHSSSNHHKIYKFLKKNYKELLLDDLSAKINDRIPTSSVGILDSISCKGITEYQEIANKCITDLKNSPSDSFFTIGWGKDVDVISYYSNRSMTIYIALVYQNYSPD